MRPIVTWHTRDGAATPDVRNQHHGDDCPLVVDSGQHASIKSLHKSLKKNKATLTETDGQPGRQSQPEYSSGGCPQQNYDTRSPLSFFFLHHLSTEG